MRLFWMRLAVALAAVAVSISHVAAASEQRTVTEGGRARTYLVHRPAKLDASRPVALVVMLHGGFGTGQQAEAAYHWDEQADREGFVVVYPDGFRRSWNGGGMCCGPALKNDVDDVAFLDRMIAAVVAAEHIDPRRIYLTGMSNGAVMSYRYACEGRVKVAAIGPVSGTLTSACARPQKVSVLAIHGQVDQNIPIQGGQGTKGVTKGAWPPVAQTISLFRSADQCVSPTINAEGAVHHAQAACPDGRDVDLITIDDAGHQWPGGAGRSGPFARMMGIDPPSEALDATSTLWRFFRDHPAK
jgi:polyhydroxybutyrate depolymerase